MRPILRCISVKHASHKFWARLSWKQGGGDFLQHTIPNSVHHDFISSKYNNNEHGITIAIVAIKRIGSLKDSIDIYPISKGENKLRQSNRYLWRRIDAQISDTKKSLRFSDTALE
jgi:hypothetical protein